MESTPDIVRHFVTLTSLGPPELFSSLAVLLQHHKRERPPVNHGPSQGWVGKWAFIATEDIVQLENLEV